jgi:hypothetical protein
MTTIDSFEPYWAADTILHVRNGPSHVYEFLTSSDRQKIEKLYATPYPDPLDQSQLRLERAAIAVANKFVRRKR